MIRRAFLGMGTNLGDRETHLKEAVEALAEFGDLTQVSGLYETEPVGGPPQGLFLNLVVELATSASPEELLDRCRALETAANRIRTVKNGPRTLDVDVLWVEGETRNTEELTVPHPRMFERRFVLSPFRELAPDLISEEVEIASGGGVARVGTLPL